MPWSSDRRFFTDPFGAVFAAEVIQGAAWDDTWCTPPAPEIADVRVIVGAIPDGVICPDWLVAVPSVDDDDALRAAVARAWVASPHHRDPGPPPEEYVLAGFHALCPPHPPCAVSPAARSTLAAFARRHDSPLGTLGVEGRDGQDRWFRVAWQTPELLADAVLLARLGDAGEPEAHALIEYLRGAEVWPEGASLSLAERRRELLDRLQPLRYFTDHDAFVTALTAATRWRAEYDRAYRAHYDHVMRLATETLAELLPAISSTGVLTTLGRHGQHDGELGREAVGRMRRAVRVIATLPERPLDGAPRTAGITLGAIPAVFGDARVAAAAVLAAVELHQRRSTTLA